MDLRLADKTSIVTGGGSNIGRAISHSFGAEGAKVVIAELDESQGSKVASEIKQKGGAALFIQTDITNNDSVVAMVQRTTDEFGPVDVLVNNAGWVQDELFIKESRQKWEKMIAINYWGFLNCTYAVLNTMIDQSQGVIISVGSDAGRMGEFREAVYGGCKGAIIATTKSLARELGRYGVRLNVVCPGLTVPESEDAIAESSLWHGEMMQIFTPEAQKRAAKAYPLQKLGKAQDLADAVLFMASERASHITGQTLSVSGGYTMM
jgi:2-hydroxycyclohexanecarboxyl-CoA dehydrogenase